MSSRGRYRQGRRKGLGRGGRTGTGQGLYDQGGPGGGQGGCPPKNYGSSFESSKQPYESDLKKILRQNRDRRE